MDSFNLDKLQALCEQGRWSEAEYEAREIAFICRRNDLIVNPPFYLRKPPPCRSSPSDRIHAVLCRLSRNRIIEGAEARALAIRMAGKWSRNSGNTMRAFSYLYSPGRYWRRNWRQDWLEDYGKLTKLARENKSQWCDLRRQVEKMRARKQHELTVRHVDLIETRDVLRGLNRAIRQKVAA